MKDFLNNKYKRQFITGPSIIDNLSHWQHARFTNQSFHVYAHPDLELTTIRNDTNKTEYILLGFAIDPNIPQNRNIDILNNIANQTNTLDQISLEVIKLAGRFILFVKIQDSIYVFHDAGGLRTVFYAFDNGNTYLGTQPLIFSEVLNLRPSKNFDVFKNSAHYKKDLEYWLPCGITLYENVHQLVPNHYFNVNTGKQFRYWPNKKIKPQELEKATVEASEVLKNLMLACSLQNKLALSITAGLDSRMLLAASKHIIKDIYVFTSQFDSHKKDHYDLTIPKSILKEINLQHNIIDCTADADKDFYNLYKSNVDLAHDSWVKVVYGMFSKLNPDRIIIQGTVSEVTRGALNPNRIDNFPEKYEQIFSYYWKDWKEIPFAMEQMSDWFSETKKICEKTNMEILDLFLLEHRTGSWNAQANNELDMVAETFTPFNHRPLLELLLGVNFEYRKYESEVLHIKIIEYLWPELLYWPINKTWSQKTRFKYYTATKLNKLGIYKPASKIYFFIHPYYMKLKKIFHLN